FIQPNQDVPDAKILSSVEHEVAFGWKDRQAGQAVPVYYPYLQRMSANLHQDGIQSFDLTDIFKNDDNTYYVDSCCHMNDAGMTVIAQAILSRIRTSGALQSIPAVPSGE